MLLFFLRKVQSTSALHYLTKYDFIFKTASPNVCKTTISNVSQGNLLKGIVNWSGVARSLVQGPKQCL
jgi:hypothetical protein